jgi:CSLREA domain-containing protein
MRALAASIVVNSTEDNATPGDAKCTLRKAINNANSNRDTTAGDCAAGSGADTITFSVSGTISLGSTLPPITSADGLTIDGSGQTLSISGANRARVFTANFGAVLALKNVSIEQGTGANDCENNTNCGGGILNNGVLTVTNSVFFGNVATEGGGIFNAGILDVINTRFNGNFRFSETNATTGSGILNAGTLNVTNSTFSINRATQGGGIFNSGTVTISSTSFSQNSGSSQGGGIFNSETGTMSIIGSTFFRNDSTPLSVGGEGGGVFNAGTLNVTNSTFAGNSAGISLGTISTASGGGIFNAGTLNVTNSTFSGDGASQGAAIFTDSGGTSILRNVITREALDDCSGPITDGGFNIDDDKTCISAPTSQTVNALLDPAGLRNNGGPTQTIALCTASGTPPGCTGKSPAIDAVPLANCNGGAAFPNPLRSDQRGFGRPAPANGTCDIGAFESRAIPLQVLNEFVSFVASNPRGDATPGGCPADYVGRFRLDGILTSDPGSPPLSNLEAKVVALTNGNLVENTDGGVGGVGATIPFLAQGGFVDGVLRAGETVRLPFIICLRNFETFSFFVDVLGLK